MTETVGLYFSWRMLIGICIKRTVLVIVGNSYVVTCYVSCCNDWFCIVLLICILLLRAFLQDSSSFSLCTICFLSFKLLFLKSIHLLSLWLPAYEQHFICSFGSKLTWLFLIMLLCKFLWLYFSLLAVIFTIGL